MFEDLILLIMGWLLGILSSLATGVLMYWLEGKREIRREAANQRREDIRTARNWSAAGRVESMKGYDLSGANLSGIDLSGADLEDANLSGALMWNTNLEDAKTIRTNFTDAVIQGAEFSRANLHSAVFDGARITEADFSGSLLRRTRLSKVKLLENCVWTSAQMDETTQLPSEHRGQLHV